MKRYEQVSVSVIEFSESDCVRTSGGGVVYEDNELPLVPFNPQFINELSALDKSSFSD